MSTVSWTLDCAECAASYDGLEERHRCECGAPLDVRHGGAPSLSPATADTRLLSRRPEDRSGVWRFREWVLPLDPAELVTRKEGHTNLYDAPQVAAWAGVERLLLKHEGENPTASFKDRGMTVAVSMAKKLGKRSVACASTGNTSASMASYAAAAGLKAYVFIPEGKVAFGKLSQAMAYGATTLQIAGDFDRAMTLVEQLAADEGVYLVNSVNPFRIEGQKAIGFELLQDLEWAVPDWIVLPGGNLGNNWAIAKGLAELYDWGFIPRLPRIAVIQAAGANPLYTAFTQRRALVPVVAETLATAIRIGNPVSWQRSLRGLARVDGVVEQVSDQEIMDAKAEVDAAGIGAEPASCATVAGLKKLVAAGVIAPDAHICGVLTGHVLKDPGTVVDYHLGKLAGIETTRAHPPVQVEGTVEAVKRALGG
ncbi:MAG: threonine synthase [Deltaproteobacteria bacterium]|nr:threonine synthase [Deltaproteobacteria bacterium]